jgi:hypothetical protein
MLEDGRLCVVIYNHTCVCMKKEVALAVVTVAVVI